MVKVSAAIEAAAKAPPSATAGLTTQQQLIGAALVVIAVGVAYSLQRLNRR